MSRSLPAASLCAMGAVVASLFAASSAQATLYTPPPITEVGCAKLELIFARGLDEPANTAAAFDGFYLNSNGVDSDRDPSTPLDHDPTKPGVDSSPPKPLNTPTDYSDRNAPWGVWTNIARELTAPPAPRLPEYTREQLHRYDVNYPATAVGPDFTASATMGYIDVTNRLNNENVRCPDKKFMLFGYSQGALVIGNVISRADRRQFWNQAVTGHGVLMTAAAKAKIVAVGLFANAGFRGHDWVKFSGSSEGPLEPAATRNWWEPAFEYEFDRVVRGTTPSTQPGLFNGSLPDLNGRRNDGTYTNGRYGITPRTIQAYYPELAFKVRDHCILLDPICNGEGYPEGHVYYQNDLKVRQNMAIFALSKLRCPTGPRDPACAGGLFPNKASRFPALRIAGL